jgi:hypothetical protein
MRPFYFKKNFFYTFTSSHPKNNNFASHSKTARKREGKKRGWERLKREGKRDGKSLGMVPFS